MQADQFLLYTHSKLYLMLDTGLFEEGYMGESSKIPKS